MAKPSITFFLRLEKKNSKTGKIPLYLRVIANREKSDIRIPLEIDPEEINLWDPIFMRFRDPITDNNRILNKYQKLFDDLMYANAEKLYQLTAKGIRNELMGKSEASQFLVLDALDLFFMDKIEKSTKVTHGTILNYKKSINHLRNFLSYKQCIKTTLEQFDVKLAKAFYEYLITPLPQYNKIGLSEPSAAGYIKKLKSIFNYYREEEIIKSNPFNPIKLKSQSPKREKLNTIEIKRLITTDLEYNPRLDRARKIFVFSIYTGLAYADAMKLKKKELIQNSDNDLYFEVKRKKTNVETRQYIVDRAYYIIKDFELHTLYKDEVLPKLSNQKLNDALRDLAEKLNIPKKLTSHIARHSFRQLLAEAGVIDMAAIKTLMGHSRSNDIDSIYHHVTDRQLLDARNKLQDYLNLLLN